MRQHGRVTRDLIFGVVVVGLLMASVACLSGGSGGHVDTGEIAFDYPDGWQSLSEIWPSYQGGHNPEFDADELTGAADTSRSLTQRYTASVIVMTREIPDGASMADVYDQVYAAMPSVRGSITEGTLTVDGVTAYERIYEHPSGEPWYRIRDIWLERNGRIYILSCRTLPGSFDAAQEDFDAIVASFHVE
jgi:hypothetical protein